MFHILKFNKSKITAIYHTLNLHHDLEPEKIDKSDLENVKIPQGDSKTPLRGSNTPQGGYKNPFGFGGASRKEEESIFDGNTPSLAAGAGKVPEGKGLTNKKHFIQYVYFQMDFLSIEFIVSTCRLGHFSLGALFYLYPGAL